MPDVGPVNMWPEAGRGVGGAARLTWLSTDGSGNALFVASSSSEALYIASSSSTGTVYAVSTAASTSGTRLLDKAGVFIWETA